jgi:hypothetical protein
MIKRILKPLAPQWVLDIRRRSYMKKQLYEWNKKGCPPPPPHIVKQMTIAEYKDKYGYNILVETGTFMGAMVEAQKKKFQKIFSIRVYVN